MTVGTAELAQRLADSFYKHNPSGVDGGSEPKGRTPKGFKRIGSGCYRVAYLHKDSGVVYKMDKYVHSFGSMNNKGEVDNYPKLVNSSNNLKHVKIPATHGYSIMVDAMKVLVVAMEHVIGSLGNDDYAHYSTPAYSEYRNLSVSDKHGGNYIVDAEGTIWPIDLGGYC